MYQINVDHFNIEQICYSGQCFRMRKNERDHFELVAYDSYLEVWQNGDTVTFSCTVQDYESCWKSYFSLDEDYAKIVEQIDPTDDYMNTAMTFGSGIRILRQDLWEMIISFLISQQNNIPRIQSCINTVCQRYGETKQNTYGEPYYTFPTPQSLAQATETDLRDCNLGYRAKYIHHTSNQIANGEFSLDAIKMLPYNEAKIELQKLYGVGIKVADCICLYGLHHLDAFPVDTHINHVLDENYKNGFPFEKYQGVAGVFQQYAFYYDLIKPLK